MPTIRLLSGDGLFKPSHLYQAPSTMDGPQMMKGCWIYSGCMVPQHQMLSCSCYPSSVWGHANYQSAHVSTMGWTAQTCANYKPVPTNAVRKAPCTPDRLRCRWRYWCWLKNYDRKGPIVIDPLWLRDTMMLSDIVTFFSVLMSCCYTVILCFHLISY